jgi:uncharacterized protein YggE
MRNGLAAVLMMLPTIAFAQNARLESGDPEPRIVSTATRTTRIAPDRVTLYLMIEGSGESPAEASQRASQKLDAVTGAVQKFASGRDAMSTVPYGVSPAQNIPGYPGSSSQTSYLARYVVRIQPSRVDQTTSLAAAAIAAGASASSPPLFEASSADSVRRLRYAEALTQARRDAESIAAALGGHLGAVIEVSSTGGFNPGANSSYVSFMNRYEFAGPVQPPEVVVTATVTVRYRFVP